MDEDENTNDTPNNDTPAPPATNGDAPATVTPPVTPPDTQEPPAPPAVPDGYVKTEEVEAERTARTAAETARTEAESRAAAAEARARAAEIKAVAKDLGFNDPSDAEKFVAADVTDIEGALASVIEAKPYLKKAAETVKPPVTPTNPTNPARPEALTLDAIKTMTPAQIAARWNEVTQVLASNK